MQAMFIIPCPSYICLQQESTNSFTSQEHHDIKISRNFTFDSCYAKILGEGNMLMPEIG
jgi:hypothetical protein